jgi:hypothetical protein
MPFTADEKIEDTVESAQDATVAQPENLKRIFPMPARSANAVDGTGARLNCYRLKSASRSASKPHRLRVKWG